MTAPVRIKFAGEPISAIPLQKLPNGSWLMKACVKHPRFDINHPIEVTPAEFIDKEPEVTDAMDA